MSLDKLNERLGKQIDRRGFLARLGIAAVGALAAMTGLAKGARASHCGGGLEEAECCCLCQPPSGSCPGGYTSQYCWTCCDTEWNPGTKYRCCEYYYNGGCDTACSTRTLIGSCPI